MPINRLTMLFESEMLSDTADAMRDVKGKEGVNSKQPALVRGRVIRGDAIAAIWFSYFLMFYWLELRTEIQPLLRNVAVEFAERSESTDVCMVVCASGVQCNSTRSWVECSHQRSSLDPGSTWVGTAWPQSATFWRKFFVAAEAT